MSKVLSFLKANALFVSMLIGFFIGFLEIKGWWFHTLSGELLRSPSWLLPSLIFLMLFFTFCKINPLDLRLHRWHWLLLGFQVIVSLLIFYLLRPFDLILAQGVMLCVLMPSATAAPIIAGKLGGSIQTLTSFTLLSSVSTAILVPAIFPFVNPEVHISFFERFTQILSHISPLLIAPFLAAWLLRIVFDAIQKAKHSDKRFHLSGIWAQLPFWVWVVTLTILMAHLIIDLASYHGHWAPIVGLFIGALLTCVMQFFVGKKIGERFPSVAHGEDYKDVLISESVYSNDPRQITRISAGQALGQKNTTLAIWMATAYLNPVSALAPAAYIVWQNIFNSAQLSRASRGKKV